MTVDDNSSIYVGGLSYNATEETLRRAFHIYGAIVAVKIINDQTVGGKCYGFVTFKNPRSAMHAIDEMDGRSIEGRVVRVNQVNTRGGRSNIARGGFRQNYDRAAAADRSRSRDRVNERGGGGVRSRSREVVRDYDRDRRRDSQRDQSRDLDQGRDSRGFGRLHHHNRTLEHIPRHRDEDQQPPMGYVESEHDRNHEQDWQKNNKNDMETSRDHSRFRKNDNGTDERPNSVDRFSRDIHGEREFSSKSSDRHEQVERKLENASQKVEDQQQEVERKLENVSQKVEDLQQEITSMEETAEKKKHAILKLQEKAQMLEDAVTTARKFRSHRQMQLSELLKCYGQVKEYNEKLKNSEQDLQNLVDSAKLGDEL